MAPVWDRLVSDVQPFWVLDTPEPSMPACADLGRIGASVPMAHISRVVRKSKFISTSDERVLRDERSFR